MSISNFPFLPRCRTSLRHLPIPAARSGTQGAGKGLRFWCVGQCGEAGHGQGDHGFRNSGSAAQSLDVIDRRRANTVRSRGKSGFTRRWAMVVIAIPHAVAQRVPTQIRPDILDGVQLRRVARHRSRLMLSGTRSRGRGVPAGAVEHEHGVRARAHAPVEAWSSAAASRWAWRDRLQQGCYRPVLGTARSAWPEHDAAGPTGICDLICGISTRAALLESPDGAKGGLRHGRTTTGLPAVRHRLRA
jgi:hypothetical protein